MTDSSLSHVGPVPHTHLPAKWLLQEADWPGRGSESRCVRSAAQLQLTSCRLEHFPPGGFLRPQHSGVNLFLCRQHIAGRHTTYRAARPSGQRLGGRGADVVQAAPPPARLALALLEAPSSPVGERALAPSSRPEAFRKAWQGSARARSPVLKRGLRPQASLDSTLLSPHSPSNPTQRPLALCFHV